LRRFAGAAFECADENATAVGITLELQKPSLLPLLIERLEANGCLTDGRGEGVCHVVHPQAADAAEEWLELSFFLRAWQARHGGIELTLRPAEQPVSAV
jgi:hypothetical protein